MTRISKLLLGGAAIVALAACSNDPAKRAAEGGVIGAGTGAVIGSATGSTTTGALLGGAAGAAAGALTDEDDIDLGRSLF